MCNEREDEHRAEQLSAMFALLTGKLEDAATIAADGQGRHPDKELLGYVNRIAKLANEAATIAGAIAASLTQPTPRATE